MESETKPEVKDGLENPEVDQDSTVGETIKQSTNDDHKESPANSSKGNALWDTDNEPLPASTDSLVESDDTRTKDDREGISSSHEKAMDEYLHSPSKIERTDKNIEDGTLQSAVAHLLQALESPVDTVEIRTTAVSPAGIRSSAISNVARTADLDRARVSLFGQQSVDSNDGSGTMAQSCEVMDTPSAIEPHSPLLDDHAYCLASDERIDSAETTNGKPEASKCSPDEPEKLGDPISDSTNLDKLVSAPSACDEGGLDGVETWMEKIHEGKGSRSDDVCSHESDLGSEQIVNANTSPETETSAAAEPVDEETVENLPFESRSDDACTHESDSGSEQTVNAHASPVAETSVAAEPVGDETVENLPSESRRNDVCTHKSDSGSEQIMNANTSPETEPEPKAFAEPVEEEIEKNLPSGSLNANVSLSGDGGHNDVEDWLEGILQDEKSPVDDVCMHVTSDSPSDLATNANMSLEDEATEPVGDGNTKENLPATSPVEDEASVFNEPAVDSASDKHSTIVDAAFVSDVANGASTVAGPASDSNIGDRLVVGNALLDDAEEGSAQTPKLMSEKTSASIVQEGVGGVKESTPEMEVKKLPLKKLEKYYKWCILGLSSHEALARAKEAALVPRTKDPHPNCKLPPEEIRAISLLISTKYARVKFIVETFLGGKDIDDQLKLGFSSSGKQRHPDCELEWEDLKEMCADLSKESLKRQFIVEAFYMGKKPADILKRLRSDETLDEIQISQLPLNQLKKYYKWRILGLSLPEALAKAKEPGLFPPTEDPHPDCKLPFEEIKAISLLIPGRHFRAKFIIDTFYGGKDIDDQLKLGFSSSRQQPHPDCEFGWEDLKAMCSELSKESLKRQFIVEVLYMGKKPADILKKLLSEETLESVQVPELPLNQLKKYYKWRIVGLSLPEAVAKAKEPGLVPPTEGPHPDCKLPFEEIKVISFLIPDRHARTKFVIETFLGGKDIDDQLKLGFSSSNKQRHCDCKMDWEDLKKMCTELPKESQKRRFIVEAFYMGKKPEDILKNMPTLQEAEDSASKLVSSQKDLSDESEISKLNLNQLKRYYIWRTTGLSSNEALAKAKELGPVPNAKDPHPNCKLSLDEIKAIASLIPAKDQSSKFFVETYFGGKDAEEQLKLAFSVGGINRHPNCLHTWEDIKRLTAELPKESMKMKFIVERFYGGKSIDLKSMSVDEKGNDGQGSDQKKIEELDQGKVSDQGKAGVSSVEREVAELNVYQLKKYYKWCILGFTPSEALSRAKKPGLVPKIKDPHPDCKLSLQEVEQVSQFIPKDGSLRLRFIVDTYFGGKDPEEQLKLMLASGNCRHSWEEIKEMSAKLPRVTDKLKFIAKAHFGTKHPRDLLNTMLSCKPSTTSELVDSPNRGNVEISSRPQSAIDSEISKLGVKRLKRYYKWCNLGLSSREALAKTDEPGCVPPSERPHPNCKLAYEEIQAISALFPGKRSGERFLVETYFGGKDIEEQLRVALNAANCKRHPYCKHTWEDLKEMSFAMPNESARWKFVVESFYGGKSPDGLLKNWIPDEKKADGVPAKEGPFVDGAVEKATTEASDNFAVDSYNSQIEPFEDPTVIEPGTIAKLSNDCLKLYYLYINFGCTHDRAFAKARLLKGFAGEEVPHSNCKFSKEELGNMFRALSSDPTSFDRFFIHTYFGGKNPECTLNHLLSRASESSESNAAVKPVEEKEKITERMNAIEKLGLDLEKLKMYLLWRRKGFPHEMALSKLEMKPEETILRWYPHINLLYTKEELFHFAKALSESERQRFVAYAYIGGFDPDVALEYFTFHSVLGSASCLLGEDISSLDSLPIDQLRRYYMLRNQAYDHRAALVESAKKSVAGLLVKGPNPNCRFTVAKLKAYAKAQGIKSDQDGLERFIVHSYYGGWDGEHVLKYLKSKVNAETKLVESTPKRKKVQFEPVAKRTRSSVGPKITVPLDDPNHPSKMLTGSIQLKKYYSMINSGLSREEAMTKAATPEFIPLVKSSRFLLPLKELQKMSKKVPSGKPRELFMTETVYGGSDPVEVMEYLRSKLDIGKRPVSSSHTASSDVSPGTSSSPNVSSSQCDAGITVPLDDPNHPSKVLTSLYQLKKYYSMINSGLSREEAMIKAATPEFIPLVKSSRCLLSFGDLRRRSDELPPGELRDLFMIETVYGGSDPEELLKNLQSKLDTGQQPVTGSVSSSSSSQHTTSTSSSTQMPAGNVQMPPSHAGSGSEEIPLDSPSHLPKELSSLGIDLSMLKNYYLWIGHGYSREEAIAKAKTPGLIPRRMMPSKCSLSMEDLQIMSMKLPPGPLREKFIVDSYYAGNDPQEVMERLLSKVDSDKEKTAECSSAVDDSTLIEDCVMGLHATKLRYYYLWRNAGFNREQAMIRMKKKVDFPGRHPVHPNSKHLLAPNIFTAKAQLRQLAQELSLRSFEEFSMHVLYGGKDPQSILKYFKNQEIGRPASNVNAPPQQKFPADVPNQPPTVPCLPSAPQHPPAAVEPHPAGMFAVQQGFPHPAFGSTGMMIPPYQHQGVFPPPHSVVDSYGQPIHGQPNYTYPPDQPQTTVPTISCPPVMYSGHPQVAAAPPSMYPSAQTHFPPPMLPAVPPPMGPAPPPPMGPAVPPPLVQPPTMQPLPPTAQHPPPLASAASGTNPATTPSSSAKPLVGLKPPEESSLKRKAIDEFPIKIKIKRQREELPKPQESTPQLESQEDYPPELDCSVPLFIVPTNYPKGSLNESQMDAIESSLLEAILEMDDVGTKPSFKDASRSNGRYTITCIDQFSVNWLQKYLSTYEPWPGASLKLVPTKIRANAILPPCKEDDNKKILKFIERQNKGLNVGMWTLVQRWDNGDFNTCLDLVIDVESAEVLQKSSTISFKLGTAQIVVSNIDALSTSKHGERNSSKDVPASSKGGSSLPSPSKFIRTGEGCPSLPNSSKTALVSDGPSTSHEHSKKTHGGSPKRSSAWRAPSRDRFGRRFSRSRTPSDDSEDEAQKSSWKKWFYSKNERKRSRSRSPSHSRSSRGSPIPRRYRRKRDDSRSPSPTENRWSRRTDSKDHQKRSDPRSSSPVRRSSRRSPSFERYAPMSDDDSRSPSPKHSRSSREMDSPSSSCFRYVSRRQR